MLHTIGYEKRDLDEVLTMLADHDVEVLVDVRGTPRSRKPGFSRTRLAAALADYGIDYHHEGELGVAREERGAFRAGDEEVRARYRERLAGASAPTVERVAALARERRVALLCFERDEVDCHRRLVARAVVERSPDVGHVPLP